MEDKSWQQGTSPVSKPDSLCSKTNNFVEEAWLTG
jgi:hypothetical protein